MKVDQLVIVVYERRVRRLRRRCAPGGLALLVGPLGTETSLNELGTCATGEQSASTPPARR